METQTDYRGLIQRMKNANSAKWLWKNKLVIPISSQKKTCKTQPTENVSKQSCKYVCDIKALFQETDQNTNECDFNNTINPHRTSKRIPNRLAQANLKPWKQPEMSLCLGSLRQHQLNEANISPILKCKEDLNFPKPLLNSISNLGYGSKYIY